MRMRNLITVKLWGKENPPSDCAARRVSTLGGSKGSSSYAFDAVVAAGAGIVGAPEGPPLAPP